jgi:cytochrome bd-type quinol oxidase subunit 2
MSPVSLLLWLHIVSMVSIIGLLLGTQLCMEREFRNHAEPSRKVARLANILLGVGLLAALAYYALTDGHSKGPHYNGVIGVKFVFLLGAGAVIGISKKTDKGDGLRWVAIGLMLLASLFGTTLN